MMSNELTSYSSIDRPWLKYYMELLYEKAILDNGYLKLETEADLKSCV